MASKRFSNQICVYCENDYSISQGDHVFARKFFLEENRANLPKVPACSICNAEKSSYETYLTAVLPFGGRHAAARENLVSMVPKRLVRNQRLKQELADGMESSNSGTPKVLPIDISQVQRLFTMITRASLWYHWGIRLPDQYAIECALLGSDGEFLFQKLFGMNSSQSVDISLGNGTFSYRGAQGMEDPNFSIWRYEIYGGLQFTGDKQHPEEIARYVGVISGSREFLREHGLIAD